MPRAVRATLLRGALIGLGCILFGAALAVAFIAAMLEVAR